jgi:transposase
MQSRCLKVWAAVDTEHALIVAHAVVLDASDIRCLKPMAEATKRALELEAFNVVADVGYSNGEHVAHCEAGGHDAIDSGHAHRQQPRRRHALRS